MLWRRWFVLFLASTIVVVLGLAGPAAAHDPGTTLIEVEATDSGIDAQIDMPLDELSAAIDQEIPTDTLALSQVREVIVGYLDEQLHFSGEESGEWPVAIGRITVIRSDGRQYVRAVVAATGEAVDAVVISSKLIVEHDDSHQIVITVINEDGTARIAGIIDADTDELTVSFADEADAASIAIVEHGFDHVLEGADHLLFLLTLLLPTPLVASAGRWRSSPGVWRGLKRVVHVATAFTLGHSISLAATALGIISLPSRPIELLIAASVAVSAVHALRPLRAGGEVVIAAGFGLVHGVAFAEILSSYGLGEGTTLRTLLAFNFGVEAAQLVTIAVAFPSLWLVSRTRAYPVVRMTGAGFALVMASAWVIDRLELASNPFATLEDTAVENLFLLAVVLGAMAVFVWSVTHRLTRSRLMSARPTATFPRPGA